MTRLIFISLICLCFTLPAIAQDDLELDKLKSYSPTENPEDLRPGVYGFIQGNDGKLAPNVRVQIGIYDMRSRREVGQDSARTDFSGHFFTDLSDYTEIPTIGLEFTTLSPQFMELIVIYQAASKDLPVRADFTLYPGTVARGTVKDKNGDPLPGVYIEGYLLCPAETNENGEFEIFGLYPEGTSQLTASKEGFSNVIFPVESTEPTTIDGIEVSMSSAAILNGNILTPQGKPVSKGKVFLQLASDQYIETSLDPEGNFIFEAAPLDLSNATIHANLFNFAPIKREISTPEQQNRFVEVRPQWPLHLKGQVTIPNGMPISGSEIMVMCPERQGQTYYFSTNAKGEFDATPLTPWESYVVAAAPPASNKNWATGEFEFTGTTGPGKHKAEVRPWPDGYESDFTVTITDNQVEMERIDSGIGGLPGTIRYTGTLDKEKGIIKGELYIEATEAKGTFTATAYSNTGNISGVWDLREKYEEGQEKYAPSMISVQGAPFPGKQTVNIILSKGKTTTGQVLNSYGDPIHNGRVQIISWNETQLFTNSCDLKTGGYFELNGLPEGALRVIVYTGMTEPLTPSEPLYLRGGLENYTIRMGQERLDPIEPLPN